MQLEFQYLFNLGIMALAGIATYLFNKSQDHERRVQKLEDVTSIKIDDLITKVDKLEVSNEKLEVSNEKLEVKIEELAHNLHKEKNAENQLTSVMKLVLLELQKRDETK